MAWEFMAGIAALKAGFDVTKAGLDATNTGLDVLSKLRGMSETSNDTPPPVDAYEPVWLGIKRREKIIGRQAEIADVRARLRANPGVVLIGGKSAAGQQAAIVTGTGGIGKSTLALAYLEKHGDEYDGGGIFITADSASAIISGLENLARGLGFSSSDIFNESHAIAFLKFLGETKRKWLIVYDNVERRSDLARLEPGVGSGVDLLVTSRNTVGWDGLDVLRVDSLPTERISDAGPQLLIHHAGHSDDPDAALALAQLLDGLPLALEHAGALIREDGGSFAAYTADYQQVVTGQLPDGAGKLVAPIIASLKLSYDALSDTAKTVADILAWWGANGLTPELIYDAASASRWSGVEDDISAEKRALIGDVAAIKAAFAELAARSILKDGVAENGTKTREMHRMDASALRAQQTAGEFAPIAAAILAAQVPQLAAADIRSWPTYQRSMPHVLGLLGTETFPRTIIMSFILNQFGVFLHSAGDYDTLLKMAQARHQLGTELFDETSDKYLTGWANLAKAYEKIGDLDKATEIMRDVVNLGRKHHTGTLDLANSIAQWADVHLTKGRGGEHEPLKIAANSYLEAHSIYKAEDSEAALEDVARMMNNLAIVRNLQGDLSAAMTAAQAAADIQAKVYPAGDPRISFALLNSGVYALKSGEWDRAMELFREAFSIRNLALSQFEKHPDLLTSAGWYISSLMIQIRRQVDVIENTKLARDLAVRFKLEWSEQEMMALNYYIEALLNKADPDEIKSVLENDPEVRAILLELAENSASDDDAE